ncbi:hypothetical protein Gotur_002625 [Gossypium turneri]
MVWVTCCPLLIEVGSMWCLNGFQK